MRHAQMLLLVTIRSLFLVLAKAVSGQPASQPVDGLKTAHWLYRAQLDGADDDTPSSPSRFAAAFSLPFGRLSGGFNGGGGGGGGASGPRSGNEGGPASPPPRTLSNLGSGLQVRLLVVFTTTHVVLTWTSLVI